MSTEGGFERYDDDDGGRGEILRGWYMLFFVPILPLFFVDCCSLGTAFFVPFPLTTFPFLNRGR